MFDNLKVLALRLFLISNEPTRVRPFLNLYGLNAVLVELDELSSGVPSFLKSDNGKMLRIAIIF